MVVLIMVQYGLFNSFMNLFKKECPHCSLAPQDKKIENLKETVFERAVTYQPSIDYHLL